MSNNTMDISTLSNKKYKQFFNSGKPIMSTLHAVWCVNNAYCKENGTKNTE